MEVLDEADELELPSETERKTSTEAEELGAVGIAKSDVNNFSSRSEWAKKRVSILTSDPRRDLASSKVESDEPVRIAVFGKDGVGKSGKDSFVCLSLVIKTSDRDSLMILFCTQFCIIERAFCQ